MNKPSSAFPPERRLQDQGENTIVIEHFNSTDIKFRDFQPEDIPTIQYLHKFWFPIEYNDSFYNSLLENSNTLTKIATYKEHVVGVMIYRAHSSWFGKKYYIMTLGVISSMRSRGIGKLFLESLDGDIELHVVDYNEDAIRFYEREGFKKVEYMRQYYDIFDTIYDGWFMTKKKQRQGFWSWFF